MKKFNLISAMLIMLMSFIFTTIKAQIVWSPTSGGTPMPVSIWHDNVPSTQGMSLAQIEHCVNSLPSAASLAAQQRHLYGKAMAVTDNIVEMVKEMSKHPYSHDVYGAQLGGLTIQQWFISIRISLLKGNVRTALRSSRCLLVHLDTFKKTNELNQTETKKVSELSVKLHDMIRKYQVIQENFAKLDAKLKEKKSR